MSLKTISDNYQVQKDDQTTGSDAVFFFFSVQTVSLVSCGTREPVLLLYLLQLFACGCVVTRADCADRYIHPEGLPSDYTISLLFRLLPDTPAEPFALWEILNKNNEPLVGVILDSESIWGQLT